MGFSHTSSFIKTATIPSDSFTFKQLVCLYDKYVNPFHTDHFTTKSPSVIGSNEPVLSPQDAVSELKEHVRAQYQRMHALLEANQAETMQMLESTYTMYVRKNSQQVLQLNERRQEAEKLLSSAQAVFQRADSINFMKVRFCTLPFLPRALVSVQQQDAHTDRKCFPAFASTILLCTTR